MRPTLELLRGLITIVQHNSHQVQLLQDELHTTRALVSEESECATRSVTKCVADANVQLQSLRLDVNRLSAHVHKMTSPTYMYHIPSSNDDE